MSIEQMIKKIKLNKGKELDLVQLLDEKDRKKLSNDIELSLLPALILRMKDLCKTKEMTTGQALDLLVKTVQSSRAVEQAEVNTFVISELSYCIPPNLRQAESRIYRISER